MIPFQETKTALTGTKSAIPRERNRRVKPLDITVLAGGPGVEREVSLESGAAVHAALERLGHRVRLLDIGPDDLSALDHPADFVFIALHGEFGEDGSLQAELDARGVAYCGSGAAASRLAMDKVLAKRAFEQAGITTPAFEVATPDNLDRVVANTTGPVVVKPVSSGSSVDTMIVEDGGGLADAVRLVVRRHGAALVEALIRGPELTVGILGDSALPVCEIRTKRDFYDYDAKYVDDDTQYLFDVDLPESLLSRVQRLSERAHRSLGCRALSRVDWIVDERTQTPYALELNTIPGFTSHSLVPKAAARVGIDFDDLCRRIVELSMA